MIAYRDFAPRQTQKSGFFKLAEFETFDAALAAANGWIQEAGVEVLNVETVVLPNIHNPAEEGTRDTSLTQSSGFADWHQFIRVWYVQ